MAAQLAIDDEERTGVITRSAGPAGGPGAGAPPTSRIVRTSRLAGPALAGLSVLVTVVLAVPASAWLPYAHGPATATAWEAALPAAQVALARAQITLGALLGDHLATLGAVVVAALSGAAAAAMLARALQRTGLSAGPASLLALVAAAAPLAAWHTSSPLGAAPLALASTVVLSWRVSRRDAARGGVLQIAGILVLVALAEFLARWRYGSSLPDTLQVMRGDLGLMGLALLPAWLGRTDPLVPRRSAWMALSALTLVTTPLPAAMRAAVLLPWAWWIVGAGVAQLVTWRGTSARRWVWIGLVVWVALHAAQIPWGHQRQQAALVRTWADGTADGVTAHSPLAVAPSAQGLLARALVASRPGEAARLIAPAGISEAAREGRRPILADLLTRDTARWQGVALDTVDDGAGVALDRLLEAMPGDVVAVAVISQDAAAQLSSRHWQALARIGLRLADAGQPRAHVVLGLTGARVEGLEVAQVGSARLDVQPGDPLGRTGARAPIDVRLDAGPDHVSVWLRGQPVLEDTRGLALLFFSTRGDLLGWRGGRDPEHLDGPALGGGPRTRSQVIASLPCLDVAPGADVAIGQLAGNGALGVSTGRAGTVSLRLSRAGGIVDDVRLATRPRPGGPVLTTDSRGGISIALPTGSATGVLLRGAVADARATSSVASRICAAWPMLHPIALAGAPLDMRVSPAFEALFGHGWHDAEVERGLGQFRWMAGTRADLLFAFRTVAPLMFALDAQGPGAPEPGDVVTLSVNGVALDPRPLLPTRGIYQWTIDAGHLHPGPNTFTIGTTRTRRPADVRPGADGRTLGLLVRGWTFSPPTR